MKWNALALTVDIVYYRANIVQLIYFTTQQETLVKVTVTREWFTLEINVNE